MNRILAPSRSVLWALAAALWLGSTGCAGIVLDEGGPDKVLVCHKGKKTLEVSAAALEAHLDHGDTRGPCR